MLKEIIFRNKTIDVKQFKQKTRSRIHIELTEREKEAVEILFKWGKIGPRDSEIQAIFFIWVKYYHLEYSVIFSCLMSSVSQGTPEGSIPLLYSTLLVKIQPHYVGGQSSNSYFAWAGLSSHFLCPCEVPQLLQMVYSREPAYLWYPIAFATPCSTSLNIHWGRNRTSNGLGSLQEITYVFNHVPIHT